MINLIFGRWKVTAFAGYDAKLECNKWHCKCICGKTGVVSTGGLKSGHSKSCGCLAKEKRALGIRAAKTTHGHASGGKFTPTYISWRNMWARCINPKEDSYQYYGARGISVCNAWQKFDVFLIDMGEKPKGYVLDRIDNEGDYEPSNCRWTDYSTSNKNRRKFGRRPFASSYLG